MSLALHLLKKIKIQNKNTKWSFIWSFTDSASCNKPLTNIPLPFFPDLECLTGNAFNPFLNMNMTHCGWVLGKEHYHKACVCVCVYLCV